MLAALLDSSPDPYSFPNPKPHHYQLYVIDPLDPASATKLDDLGTSTASVPPQPMYGFSYSANRAAHTWSYNGASTVMYVNGGKVWTSDLRAGKSHAPRQTSATNDACGISPYSSLLQVSADGHDMWLLVEPCLASGAPMFVRSTMSASDAPVSTLPDTLPIAGLDDGAKNAVGFLVRDRQGLAFYSTDMVRLGNVAGAAGLTAPSNGVRDYAGGQSSYGRFGNGLRRMTWTSSGATLEAPIYTFNDRPGGSVSPGWISDVGEMFFSDGNTLLRLTSGGAPQPLAALPGTAIGLLSLTDERVVIQQADRSPGQVLAVSTIPKTGGSVTLLASTGALAIGTTANSVVYSQGGATHIARADGSGDQVIPGGGTVYQRQHVADRRYLEGLSACVPDAQAGTSCSNGSFAERVLATQARIDVGRISHATTYLHAALFGGGGYGVVLTTTGVPEWLTYFTAQDASGHAVNTQDLYVWTPGTANSLARITTNIP